MSVREEEEQEGIRCSLPCPSHPWKSVDRLGGVERTARVEQARHTAKRQLIGEERQPPVLTQGSFIQSQPIIGKAVSTRPAPER